MDDFWVSSKNASASQVQLSGSSLMQHSSQEIFENLSKSLESLQTVEFDDMPTGEVLTEALKEYSFNDEIEVLGFDPRYQSGSEGYQSESEDDSQRRSRPSTETTSTICEVTEGLDLVTDALQFILGRSRIGILEYLTSDHNKPATEVCQDRSGVYSPSEGDLAKIAQEALDLIHAGLSIEIGDPNQRSLRCLLRRARPMRKNGVFEDTERLYRHAIQTLMRSADRKRQVQCQLVLSDFLLSLGRYSEPLHLLLEVIIEDFRRPSIDAKSALKIIDCFASVSREVDLLDGELIRILSRLKNLRSHRILIWFRSPYSIELEIELVQLGSYFSQTGKFQLADLCFTSLDLSCPPEKSPRIWIHLFKVCIERCEYYRRTGMIGKGIEQLGEAMVYLSSLMDETMEEADAHLRLMIFGLKEQVKMTVKRLSAEDVTFSHQYSWVKVQVIWARVFEQLPVSLSKIPHKPASTGRIGSQGAPTSLSSHGSSLLSAGSASSRFGITFSVGSESSVVSNSVFMVP
jgi:hypothetical protein